ncbi:unnamed protein product [Kuraishia capsulata CBS 1993]|uniref:RNB domain-containing protein n=1 Tax=Kuraishia capsulata CBS 1993 TaxID=1382522 RepID=W6MLT0_9ASCO|nr:uncharacterized protein KUCA_T00001797001 [Kuraishia capsulata CBS 1993]CDK25827.1 unnamed protein product [Kuraishia capsulata CBS 1993]
MYIFRRSPVRLFHTTAVTLRVRRGPPKQKTVLTPDELVKHATTATLDEIKNGLEYRNQLRFVKPNESWLAKSLGLSPESPKFCEDTIANRVKIKNLLSNKFGKINRSFTATEFLHSPLDVGDVVDLSCSFESSELAVVVELPISLEDPRYSLLTHTGELKFMRSSSLSSRIPRFFPKKWFENCVFNERYFLRDDSVLLTGSPRFKEEDARGTGGVVESAISKAIIQGDDSLETYIVPSLLAGIVSYELSKLLTESWSLLPAMNMKLELIHTAMQNSESVTKVSIFQIVDAINATDLSRLSRQVVDADAEVVIHGFKGLSKSAGEAMHLESHFNEMAYGRQLGELEIHRKIYADIFYSLVLALRKNSQLFYSDTDALSPVSVALIPLETIVRLDALVTDMKDDPYLFTLVTTYMGKLLCNEDVSEFDVPDDFHEVIHMMKLYCGGSIADEKMESFVVKVIRSLPKFGEMDISRALVYDILLRLGEISNTDSPVNWWLMNPCTSLKAEMEQEYYDSITSEILGLHTTTDRAKSIRKSFREEVVYCIDAADAHEIDDGISIRKQDGKWTVSAFVADPASYLSPDSPISQIAFERASTLYFRDGSSVGLLPKALVDASQLGHQKDTRVMRFAFDYDSITGDADFEQAHVNVGTASLFVKITYDEVDEILSGDFSDAITQKLQEQGVSLEHVREDLESLHRVSTTLQRKRMQQGALSNTWFNRINLERVEEVEDNIEIKVKPNNITTPSQTLVSEIMIASGRICGHYMASNSIPAVYRSVPAIPQSDAVTNEIDAIRTGATAPTFANLMHLSNFVGKSAFSVLPSPHAGLGIPVYANCTSPLRRFCDMLNHWQIQAHLMRTELPLTEENLSFAAVHLVSQESIASKLDRRSSAFFMFKYLEHEYQDPSRTLAVMVTGMASKEGVIPVMLKQYGVRAVMRECLGVDTLHKKKPLASLSVGDTIENTRIVGLDVIEGNMILESDMY